ncbi:MAG: hypothetical protein HRT89_02360 [Lentisphaeria bacterium]|nr:hypothetical protein [Lentisphaeria bacterium]NQZ66891.1 hypothetical protein [Lentisphaeria bacterium]
MNFEHIIQELHFAEIDFILIGGVCAALHGASITTYDIDFLYRNSEENNQKILDFLLTVNASHRGQAGKVILPDIKQLNKGGQFLFKTDLGEIDMLSFIGNTNKVYYEYDYYIQNKLVDEIEILNSKICMLSLDGLIGSKQVANRKKDELHLLHLKALKDQENQ